MLREAASEEMSTTASQGRDTLIRGASPFLRHFRFGVDNFEEHVCSMVRKDAWSARNNTPPYVQSHSSTPARRKTQPA